MVFVVSWRHRHNTSSNKTHKEMNIRLSFLAKSRVRTIYNAECRMTNMKRTKNGITLNAIVATIMLVTSLWMMIFEKDYFPFNPFIVLNIGLIFSFGVTDVINPKTTLKEFLPRILLVFLIVGVFFFALIKIPLFSEPPPQPYRSILQSALVLAFIVFVWRRWYKAINKKQKHSRSG